MTEAFLGLSAAERSEALQVAASTSGRPLHVLEKDVWVVWTLSALFESDFRKHLVFKGGTSLSKAYQPSSSLTLGNTSSSKGAHHYRRPTKPSSGSRKTSTSPTTYASSRKTWSKTSAAMIHSLRTRHKERNGQTKSDSDCRCGSMNPYYLISSANLKRWG